jgi:dienelactone hydrolase
MIRLLGGIAMAVFSICEAADPFLPFMNSVPPVKQVLGETKAGTGAGACVVRRFTFSSRNGMNTVFGIYGYPQAAGKYPAVLCLHGGGSNAETLSSLVQGFAQRGYAALAVDLPGICGTENTPNTTGPWKSRPLGEGPRFEVAAAPENSTLMDAETAGLEGFNWLASQATVDTSRMGITGYSWGGYSTTFLSGTLGGRVKAAYAVFGCGFYDKGSAWKKLIAGLDPAVRQTWLTWFDAGRRAPGMRAAYFLDAASNDTFLWPEAVSATLAAVPGSKNHVWGPNFNHAQMPAGGTMQRLWFDFHLKGQGQAFGTAEITTAEPLSNGNRKVTIHATAPSGVGIDSVRLWYSLPDSTWQVRKWISIAAKQDGAVWTAELPASAKLADYYAIATDSRSVAVASSMYNATSVPTAVRTIRTGKSRTIDPQAAVTPRFNRPGESGTVDALGKDRTGIAISRGKANRP